MDKRIGLNSKILLFVLSFFFMLNFSFSQYSIDSLYQSLKTGHDSVNYIEKIEAVINHAKKHNDKVILQFSLLEKSKYYLINRQILDTAILYNDSAIHIQTNDDNLLREVFAHRGYLAKLSGDSLYYSYYNKALFHNSKLTNPDTLFEYRVRLSFVSHYTKNKEYERALNLLNEALEFYEKRDDKIGVSGIFLEKSVIYFYKNDYLKSIEYQSKAYEIRKGIPNYIFYRTGALLAHYYTLVDSNEKALNIINETIDSALKRKSTFNLIDIYFTKAEILANLGDKSCIPIIDSLLAVNDNKGREAGLLKAKGIYYLENGEYGVAEKLFLKTIPIYDIYQEPTDYINIYKLLIPSLKGQGKYKEALDYALLKDSIEAKILQDDYSELERRFNVSKEKEKRVEALNQRSIAEKQAVIFQNKSRVAVYWILGVSFLVIIVIIAFLIVLRVRREREKSQKIALEQKLLTSQMNPHFISNALGVLQTFIVKNDTEESLKFLSNFAKVSRGILTSSKEDFILIEEEFNILKNYMELQQKRFEGRVESELHIDKNLLNEELMILPMLLQPIIENAFEYGTVKNTGYVGVTFETDKNAIKITVKDKGRGIQNQTNTTSKKSYSSGIIRDRIERFNSKNKQKIQYNVNSSDEGTTVVILFPKIYLS